VLLGLAMDALPGELWSAIAVWLACCDDLRTVAHAVTDLSHLQSVCRKTRGCGTSAFNLLVPLCNHSQNTQTSSHDNVQPIIHRHLLDQKQETVEPQFAADHYCLNALDLGALGQSYVLGRYLKRDVIEKARSKWGTATRLQLAKAEEEAQTIRRKDTMKAHLAQHGLKLREDSRLCSMYIASGSGDPAQIADTMVEMNWLFKKTNYSQKLQQVSLRVYALLISPCTCFCR